MKQFILLILFIGSLAYTMNNKGQVFMQTKTIGQLYIEFLQLFKDSNDADLSKEIEALFSPTLIKVINSYQISKNRTETFKQMNEIRVNSKPFLIRIHEYLESADHRKCAIRWEISYADDNTTESVITIITANGEGLIAEINEVFGEKNIYQWSNL